MVRQPIVRTNAGGVGSFGGGGRRLEPEYVDHGRTGFLPILNSHRMRAGFKHGINSERPSRFAIPIVQQQVIVQEHAYTLIGQADEAIGRADEVEITCPFGTERIGWERVGRSAVPPIVCDGIFTAGQQRLSRRSGTAQ